MAKGRKSGVGKVKSRKGEVGRVKSGLGIPIGIYRKIDKSTGEVFEKKLYSPNKRTKHYIRDLKTGTKIDKNGNVVKLSNKDRQFRSGYLTAKMDETALYKFNKRKHRA